MAHIQKTIPSAVHASTVNKKSLIRALPFASFSNKIKIASIFFSRLAFIFGVPLKTQLNKDRNIGLNNTGNKKTNKKNAANINKDAPPKPINPNDSLPKIIRVIPNKISNISKSSNLSTIKVATDAE
jgi:hypothetical protein